VVLIPDHTASIPLNIICNWCAVRVCWNERTWVTNKLMNAQNEFLSEINDVLDEVELGQGFIALFIVRLKHLDDIKTTYGATIGDELLRRVEQRINHVLRPIDRLLRIGESEFCIALPALSNSSHAVLAANKIIGEFNQPFIFDEQRILPKIVMGISTNSGSDIDHDELIQDAINALAEAERSNESFRLNISETENEIPSRLILENEMHYAYDHEEFSLYFQPKIDIAGNRLEGIEALIRWFSPRYGQIDTQHFVDILDGSNILVPVTKWVLNVALQQCLECQKISKHFTVAVNLSPALLKSDEIVDMVIGAVRIWGVDPSSLVLEVTEEAIINSPSMSLEALKKISDEGIGISIDDFGTGHSSLSLLTKLPVKELKIDKSFVINMQNDADDRKITKAVIDLAHNFGMKVVAEGIETGEALELLIEMGCDQGQGYYVAKPMPRKDIKKWLVESDWVNKTQSKLRAGKGKS